MHQPVFSKRAMLGCASLILALSAQAQVSTDANVAPATAKQQDAEIVRGEPARWQREDTTLAARLRTIRNETAAGLQENLGVCKAGPAAQRAACTKEARATYQLEMAGAKARAESGQ